MVARGWEWTLWEPDIKGVMIDSLTFVTSVSVLFERIISQDVKEKFSYDIVSNSQTSCTAINMPQCGYAW